MGQDFFNNDRKYKYIEYPLDDEIIKKTEEFLLVKFPHPFIDLMKIQNGGELNCLYRKYSLWQTSKPSFYKTHPF